MRNTTSERRPRILVVGSFVMDQIAVTSKFPKEGQSVIGRSFQKAPGGKGANQAVQAARLGAEEKPNHSAANRILVLPCIKPAGAVGAAGK